MNDCTEGGDHDLPAGLDLAFPWIERAPGMPEVLAAAWFECSACMARYRDLAVEQSVLPSQALFLWLATLSVTRYEKGLPPVASADAMMDAFPVEIDGSLRDLLRKIPLTEADPGGGRVANTWDHMQAHALLGELPREEYERIWKELLALLTGWLLGISEADADMRAGQYPRKK